MRSPVSLTRAAHHAAHRQQTHELIIVREEQSRAARVLPHPHVSQGLSDRAATDASYSSRTPRSALIQSMGSGKMIVEFLSAAMSVSVWR